MCFVHGQCSSVSFLAPHISVKRTHSSVDLCRVHSQRSTGPDWPGGLRMPLLPSRPSQSWFCGYGVRGGGRFGERAFPTPPPQPLYLSLNPCCISEAKAQGTGFMEKELLPRSHAMSTSCLTSAAEESGSGSSAGEIISCSRVPGRWGRLLFLLRYEPVLDPCPAFTLAGWLLVIP